MKKFIFFSVLSSVFFSCTSNGRNAGKNPEDTIPKPPNDLIIFINSELENEILFMDKYGDELWAEINTKKGRITEKAGLIIGEIDNLRGRISILSQNLITEDSAGTDIGKYKDSLFKFVNLAENLQEMLEALKRGEDTFKNIHPFILIQPAMNRFMPPNKWKPMHYDQMIADLGAKNYSVFFHSLNLKISRVRIEVLTSILLSSGL